MNDSKNFAKDRPLQLAMRELQGLVRRAPFWIGFACVVTMLTVSAPFDTDRQFSDAERLVYWAGVAAITFAFGYVTVRSLGTALTQTNPRLPPLMAHLTAGLIAGPFIGVIVFAINVGIAGIDERAGTTGRTHHTEPPANPPDPRKPWRAHVAAIPRSLRRGCHQPRPRAAADAPRRCD